MQNYCKTIGALAAASALVAGNAQAEVEYEIHTGYSSMYLFRGLDLGEILDHGADRQQIGLVVVDDEHPRRAQRGGCGRGSCSNTALS